MTPCEKLGYKVGDKFEVIEGDEYIGFRVGQIIELNKDDGSESPLFKGDCNYFLANDCNSKGSYFYLLKVKPLDKSENNNDTQLAIANMSNRDILELLGIQVPNEETLNNKYGVYIAGFMPTNEQVENLYLSWVNDFVTVERFSEYYGISYGVAHELITQVREYKDLK